LEELKDRFLKRLSIFHVISGEEQDIPILHGRLDGEKVRVLLRSLVPASSVDHVFICGPAGMSEDIEATCREIGIAEDRIHVERFVSEFGGKPRAKKAIPASAPPKALAQLSVHPPPLLLSQSVTVPGRYDCPKAVSSRQRMSLRPSPLKSPPSRAGDVQNVIAVTLLRLSALSYWYVAVAPWLIGPLFATCTKRPRAS